MRPELTDSEKLTKLPWVLATDTCNVVFVFLTFGGSIFPLFLDKLQLDKKQIGMVLSLFPFCGLLAVFTARAAAHVGYKRTFMSFWGIRKFVFAAILLSPWILTQYGQQAVFYYVTAIVITFAICRAIAESAYFPWYQEFVPNVVRGKFFALQNLIVSSLGFAVILLSAWYVGEDAQLHQFIIIFTIACAAGLASLLFISRVPGGEPAEADDVEGHASFRSMIHTLRDSNFLRCLAGIGLGSFTGVAMNSFSPLYLKEQIGLGDDYILLMQGFVLGAMVFTVFLWGWAADRYGSKPVMIICLALLLVHPLGLWLLPHQHPWSLPASIALHVTLGLIVPGWTIGQWRQLMNSIVPPKKRSSYLPVYYAWIGLTSGLGPLVAGLVFNRMHDVSYRWSIFTVDPYSFLFAAQLISVGFMLWILGGIRTQGEMPVREFAGLFMQGNPIAALQSLVSYNFARNEQARVFTIERLSDAKSPLIVEELLQALKDPSFNVRYEAVVAIARMRPHPKLTESLIGVLRGNEPDLSIAAAWALGRVGDKRAIEPLRETLMAGYALLAARSARALAMLGDTESIPVLLARLHDELDDGLRTAYAAALGSLRCRSALDEILELLHNTGEGTPRTELALAVARIIGDEDYSVRLWRKVNADRDTALSQAVAALRKKITRAVPADHALKKELDQCVQLFGQDDVDGAVLVLMQLVGKIPLNGTDPAVIRVLDRCTTALQTHQGSRMEYLVLYLHALDIVFTREEKR